MRKRSVLYEIAVLSNFRDVIATQEIRLRFCSHFCRFNPVRLGVKNTALGDIETYIPIDSDVTSQFYVVCVGIVLCVIGINIRVADMNGDIVPRRCQPVFICRFSSGGDFNRSILRSLDLSFNQTGTREEEGGEQQNWLSHGGRRRYCTGSRPQSQKHSALMPGSPESAKDCPANHWIDNSEPVAACELFRSRNPATCWLTPQLKTIAWRAPERDVREAEVRSGIVGPA